MGAGCTRERGAVVDLKVEGGGVSNTASPVRLTTGSGVL